jgi:hypothetical protein
MTPADPSAPRLCLCGHPFHGGGCTVLVGSFIVGDLGYCACGEYRPAAPPVPEPVTTSEPPFDLAAALNDFYNAAQDRDEEAGEEAQTRIVDEFARLRATPPPPVDRGGEDIGALVDALEAVCTGGGRNAAGGEWLHDIQAARAALDTALAALTREHAELRERAERAERERDEALETIEWTGALLESGSVGVPCDSEAASYLGDTIDRALRSLSVARAALASSRGTAPTPIPETNEP